MVGAQRPYGEGQGGSAGGSPGEASLFLELAAEKQDVLLPLSQVEQFSAGDRIIEFGAPAENFYMVERGYVRLLLESPCGGKTSTIDVVGAGGAFGESAVTNNGRYEFTAIALDEVELRAIPGEVLRRLLSEDPDLVLRLMGRLSFNMHSLMNQIADLKMRTTAERLAMFLLQLAGENAGVAGGAARVKLPYDKRVVAEKLGMTPETLSRTFAKLKKIGVQTRSGNAVEIADLEALADYCGFVPEMEES